MKLPENPPPYEDLFNEVMSTPKEVRRLSGIPIDDSRYFHWDELRHRPPPSGLTHREWWMLTKFNRRAKSYVVLEDQKGARFHFGLPDRILRFLHRIDLGAGGKIEMPDQITNAETRDQYYVGSLIEEAITSSQLEGATTTRKVAKEMLRTGRQPSDRSERMILNNFLTMRRIGELKHQPLTEDLVFEIHRIVTDGTLDDPTAAGRFRRDIEAERIAVYHNDLVLHTPPHARELPARMKAMCDFANGGIDDDAFLHPAIRSVILHFWVGYDHPFCDGNGRTARALFYWSMLRNGYWLFEFISISRIMQKAPTKYGMAYLYTETDDNDLTYFIIYHLDVVKRAVEGLHKYIDRKTKSLKSLEARLRGMQTLNHRQRAFVSFALRHPHGSYTVESHRSSHNVSYETARTDLLNLVKRGFLKKQYSGKKLIFMAPRDLEERLAK